MVKKLLLIGVGAALIFVATVFADDANNSDETLQIFSASRVRLNGTEPSYVSEYMDRENHYVESVNDFYVRISGGLEIDAANYNSLDVIVVRESSGVFGMLTLGYGRKFFDNEIYFGLALDGTMNSVSSPFTNKLGDIYNGSISMPRSYGAYVIAGVYPAKATLVYLKAGAVRSKYNSSLNDNLLQQSFNKNIFGYSFGGGFDFFLNKYISFNIEYLYTDYRSYVYQNIWNGQIYNHNFEPSSNQISVGLGLHLS